MKIPCKDCLLLSMCMNKKVISCELLFNYFNTFKDSPYLTWKKSLNLMRRTLKEENLHVICGVSDKVTKIINIRLGGDST